MIDLLKKSSTISLLITILYIGGIGVYNIVISLFNIESVGIEITVAINYVLDLVFNSLNLLSFFIRPTTLSYVCKIFISYYFIYLEIKFMKVCIRLITGLYSKVFDLLGKSSQVVLGLFGFK